MNRISVGKLFLILAQISADEVANAINQQKSLDLVSYNEMVREHIYSITAIKDCIEKQNWSGAVEAWHEIPDADKKTLWKAPKAGGIFTTKEREAMKSNEWHQEAKLRAA